MPRALPRAAQSVHVPREVVFLNGAPGSGKVRATSSHAHARTHARALACPPARGLRTPVQGANTVHILKTRGLDMSISVSSLLVGATHHALHAARAPLFQRSQPAAPAC